MAFAFRAFGPALGLALRISIVKADTNTSASCAPVDTIQVCVNKNSLNLDKIEPTEVESVCPGNELLLEWLNTAGTNALDARIAA